MEMPGRKYDNGSEYRYGFNGKEKDNDVTKDDYDFGARIYDGRLGRWLSKDPLQTKYPNLSPYNFCANSPISAKDPDGRLIIFINGLWGNTVGIPQPLEPYWGSDWVKDVQSRIEGEGSKNPMFIDGSLGGVGGLFWSQLSDIDQRTTNQWHRKRMGDAAGYESASSIIAKLDKGETIKIVTNSMGAAFERGFTNGLLRYQTEENAKRLATNTEMDRRLAPLTAQRDEINIFLNAADKAGVKVNNKNQLINQLTNLNNQINYLQSQKKELLNVKIEMVVDLSSHQVNYPDPNAQKNFYMMANQLSEDEQRFIDEQKIGGNSQQIGLNSDGSSQMACHYGPCAPAQAMPESSTKKKTKKP